MARESKESKPPRQFGMFYPRGYVIVAFLNEENAERTRQLLVDGGYAEDDVQLMDTKQVLEGSSADLQHLSPLIKALGSESRIMESHRAGAATGQTFKQAKDAALQGRSLRLPPGVPSGTGRARVLPSLGHEGVGALIRLADETGRLVVGLLA